VNHSNALAITGATVIDATGRPPIDGGVILLDKGRIAKVGDRSTTIPAGFERIDARGKYAIPGLMNANVHLSSGILSIERTLRHMHNEGEVEDIIVEAAQMALRNGLTTVFDTCGLRRALMGARDRINSGARVGSRFFCAGWIVGFDGGFSADFQARAAEIVSTSLLNRINAMYTENVGRHLMWLTPSQVAAEVRTYIGKGVDFIKYASNEHFAASGGAFLQFSYETQAAIVAEARRAGITAQAHTMTVEGLRIAVTAGCNLVQHANITGPTPIPEETLELMASRRTGAVIFPWTHQGLEWIKQNVSDMQWSMWQCSDINARRLIGSGVPLLLANDGTLLPPEWRCDPKYAKSWSSAPEEHGLVSLATGHFNWFKAMEEKGCPPMEMLRAATANIAVAYGKDRDLGTLEAGKLADVVLLDRNPLQAADNYRHIHAVIKEGVVVNREELPLKPMLTKPLDPPAPEEASYRPAIQSGLRLPLCPCCVQS
jgi:imidazolonepropionase-like amidohydrolase